MSKREEKPIVVDAIIVDADETTEDYYTRRIREIHEEVAYNNTMTHLEFQMRYDKRREETDAFWEEWERKHNRS